MEFFNNSPLFVAAKRAYFVLRNDPAAMVQARQAFLGGIVCLVLLWAGITVLVEPKVKLFQQKSRHLQEIGNSAPGKMLKILAAREKNLIRENQIFKEKIEIVKLRERLLKESWQQLGDSDRFSRIIFTLFPAAPVAIDDTLKQMNLQPKRSNDGFCFYPVSLEGDASFFQIFDYLQYLEQQTEVGFINNLIIEDIDRVGPDMELFVHFSMIVGRITLGDE